MSKIEIFSGICRGLSDFSEEEDSSEESSEESEEDLESMKWSFFPLGSVRQLRFCWKMAPVFRDYYLFLQKKKQTGGSDYLAEKWAVYVAGVFLELGGFYVKAGQYLAAFPTLPVAYAKAFGPLRSGVRPRSKNDLAKFLKEDIDVDWTKPPLGAASIGQVHAGIYKKKEVAVKFLYPEVSREFSVDLSCFVFFMKVLAKAQGLPFHKKQAKHMAKNFLAELDFNKEFQNLHDIRQALLHFPLEKSLCGDVRVPKPYFCTSKILVMDLLDGKPLSDLLRDEKQAVAKAMGVTLESLDDAKRDAQRALIEELRTGKQTPQVFQTKSTCFFLFSFEKMMPYLQSLLCLWCLRFVDRMIFYMGLCFSKNKTRTVFDAKIVSERLVYTVGRLMLVSGVCTADPHAGNCLVRENSEIALVDMGNCFRMTIDERLALAELILAIHHGNVAHIARLWRKAGAQSANDDILARVATLALSHFDLSTIRGQPLLAALKHETHVNATCLWLLPCQRATEILRGLNTDLGLRQLRLCDTWADLARETIHTFAPKPRVARPLHKPGGSIRLPTITLNKKKQKQPLLASSS